MVAVELLDYVHVVVIVESLDYVQVHMMVTVDVTRLCIVRDKASLDDGHSGVSLVSI